jgi:hypothetical protein
MRKNLRRPRFCNQQIAESSQDISVGIAMALGRRSPAAIPVTSRCSR